MNIEELDDEVIKEQLYENEGFRIDTPSKLEWGLKKIAKERAEIKKMETVVEQAILEYQKKLEAFREKHNTRWIEFLLNQYFQTVPHKIKKTQETYESLSGTLKLKLQKLDYEKDEDSLVSWASANRPELVTINQMAKVDWLELKKELKVAVEESIDEDGEIHETEVVLDKDGRKIESLKVTYKPSEFSVEV